MTEAALSGAPTIPLFIYVTSFVTHEGELTYVLPFVLFYCFNKSGDFILEMFGTFNNPYRLAQLGAIAVIIGAGLSIFDDVLFIDDLGAALVGFGTSVFGPMYRTLKEEMQNEGTWPYGRTELIGYPLMIAFVTFVLITEGYMHILVLSFYIAMSVVALFTLWGYPVPEEEKGRPLFIYANRSLRKGIPALIFLSLIFFARVFKQTANIAAVLGLFIITTLVLVVIIMRKTYATRQVFEYHGVFYNEMLVYMILFDAIWLISRDSIAYVLIIQIAWLLGMYLAIAFGKRILPRFKGWKISNIIILCLMASSVLYLFDATNGLSVLLSMFFVQLGLQRISALYHVRESFTLATLYLESKKMSDIGMVVGQTILITVLTVVSLLVFQNAHELVSAYAYRLPLDNIDQIFRLINIICLTIFWIQGIAITLYEKFVRGPLFKYPPGQDS